MDMAQGEITNILYHNPDNEGISFADSTILSMHTIYFMTKYMKQAPICMLLHMTVDVAHAVAKFGDTTLKST